MTKRQPSAVMQDLTSEDSKSSQPEPNRREFLTGLAGVGIATAFRENSVFAEQPNRSVNIARVAVASGQIYSSENKLSALNDGGLPQNSSDRLNGVYALRHESPGESAETWVQYEWSDVVNIGRVEVYWAVDRSSSAGLPGSSSLRKMRMPAAYRLLYWDGHDFLPVQQPVGLGVADDKFNVTTFTPVKTNRLRLSVTLERGVPSGILEWAVYNSGQIPTLPPVIDAGVDRSVVLGANTYLAGKVIWLEDSNQNVSRWNQISGPGIASFDSAASTVGSARFSAPGDYVLTLSASGSDDHSKSIKVHVEPKPPKERLDVVYTRKYSIDSQFWNGRARVLIVNWIPHCIDMCERTDIPAMRGDGGLDNFIEAGKANRGEPHGKHKGYVFSNAWVHQTVESMCIALMIDPGGDPDIERAQALMRSTLDRWIPIILAAQMPDGYLQTAYTLSDRQAWPERWSPDHRGNHEGYTAGYFIESAINHYTLTEGQDLRLYNAAKKLADCWVANIGPGKREWFDGHQEMEQALVRFGRFVNDQEGNHRGDAYIVLAKFLLDSRKGGSEYDQSHLPPGQQYEAVGHAVRATYFYSGMADIAAETQDPDYQSAVISLWDNMVNKKYYVTGGIGSGETAEGFGPNYSLRNEAYCETCSSCGLIFFQYKLNLAYHDAKYADLYEQTMYNALLGGVALDGKSYTYTNPLVDTQRAQWHVCPCCVGNLSRTLLMIPTWAYVKGDDALYVNMYVGSRIHVGKIAGTDVEILQKTDYPWKGSVALTVNPKSAKSFSIFIRVPNRTTSKLYSQTPSVSGLKSISVNGVPVEPKIVKGYAEITREWNPGDHVDFELPMEPQRLFANELVVTDKGRVALQYGPLIYNVEESDNGDIQRKLSSAPLQTRWEPDLLGGVTVITGEWQDGSKCVAVPNYARMNRNGPAPAYPNERITDTGAVTLDRTANQLQSVSKVWI